MPKKARSPPKCEKFPDSEAVREASDLGATGLFPDAPRGSGAIDTGSEKNHLRPGTRVGIRYRVFMGMRSFREVTLLAFRLSRAFNMVFTDRIDFPGFATVAFDGFSEFWAIESPSTALPT